MQFKVGDKQFDGFCLVDKDGNPLTVGNPIPTSQNSSFADAIFREIAFTVHSFSVAAGGAGTYAKAQIFNPVDSGKKIYVVRASTWQASGNITYQSSVTTNPFSDDIGTQIQKLCAGGRVEPVAQLRKKNTETNLSALYTSKNGHSSTASNGSSVLDQQITLLPGQGLNIECNTANTAFNGIISWSEIPNELNI